MTKEDNDLIIPNTIATIGSYAMHPHPTLEIVVIGKGLKTVDNNGLYNFCINIVDITSKDAKLEKKINKKWVSVDYE